MARSARRLRRMFRKIATYRSSNGFPLVGGPITDTLVVDGGKPLVVG